MEELISYREGRSCLELEKLHYCATSYVVASHGAASSAAARASAVSSIASPVASHARGLEKYGPREDLARW